MTTVPESLRAPAGHRSRFAWLAGGPRYDWLATLCAAWLIGGAFLDAWAHSHDKAESFFTPWHGVLYSGYLALVLFLAGTYAVHARRDLSWRHALPTGYDLSLLGALVFGLGGLFDMAWHLSFGIEVGVEATLSPSHLMLGLGAVLMVTGPVRAAWRRGDGQRTASLRTLLPAILGLCFALSLLSFFTAYAHPYVDAWSESMPGADRMLRWLMPGLGVASILVQTALLMGAVLLFVYRWSPPFGSFTLLFGLNALLMSFFQDQYRWIPVAVAAGLVADGLALRLRPAPDRPAALRAFAALTPAVLFGLYFGLSIAQGQLAWSIHLWTGAVVLAAAAGYSLSLLLVPPATTTAPEA